MFNQNIDLDRTGQLIEECSREFVLMEDGNPDELINITGNVEKMLYFKLYPFTLLRQCRSFTFLFMYLGELLQYYQSSNNLPQSVQTLDFDFKSCFVLLNTSSRSTRC